MNQINYKNDILIYDKSETLIRLVKHYCGENIEVIFCNSEKQLEQINLNTISTAFVSSNDKNDFLEIRMIHQNVNMLYVNTQSRELRIKLATVTNIIFFDLTNDKFNVMNQIFNKTIGFE